MQNKYKNIAVVILAAGKGTRLGCTDIPKAMLEIGGKPIVSYIVKTLENIGFTRDQIVLVVGFQKEKVKEYFGSSVAYADQDQQLGTAHAALTGIKILSEAVDSILVLGGDDSAFYTPERLIKFIDSHIQKKTKLSLLTVEPVDPSALGRVIRNDADEMIDLVEKEELDEEQKKLTEISTGTFCFDRLWFEENYNNISKISGLGELGLPQYVSLAKKQAVASQAIKLEIPNEWFGINTPEELEEANKRKIHNS
jgi:bifunctional N-acetylglucosamine-1-phosphate-uridyltransferase/glucosamine-1-phosphate-acetyltransferase GlmU-like protein